MRAVFPAFAPKRPDATELALFFARVQVQPNGCWLWTGAINGKGYGAYKGTSAHRFTYAWFVEPIAAGLEVDHLCRERRCVNPAHGDAVTGRENRWRANRFERTGKCRRGHVLAVHGFAHNGVEGLDRICRACRRLSHARYLQRHGLPLSNFAVVAIAQESMRLSMQDARQNRRAS